MLLSTSSVLLGFSLIFTSVIGDAVVQPLQFTHFWPKSEAVITSGEANEILLGVRNVGEVPRTVAFVSAAFANPLNLSQVWRNISGHSYEIVLSQNQEATVPFLLDFLAEPQDVGLVVYVHHQGNERAPQSSIAFEQVVKVIDKHSIFDFQSLSAYAMIGVLAFGGFYLYSTSGVSPVAKKTSKVSSAPSPAVRKEESQQSGSDSVDLEWIPEHLKGQKPKTKKRSAK